MKEIYFAWKEPFMDEGGNMQLITPLHDSSVLDFIFHDIEDAIRFLKGDASIWNDARIRGWQLVSITQVALPIFANEVLDGVEDED